MISLETLRTQFTRLINNYGRKNYSNERILLLRDIVKEITDKEFIALVDKLILNCRNAPMEKEFNEYLSAVREDKRLKEIRENREEISRNYSSTPLGDLLKEHGRIDLNFNFKAEIEKLARENLGFEVKWREDHQKRLKENYKPSFKIGDPTWNAQFFPKG
jgi:hypothetical protein